MKTKVLQVFYNENGLPFKDQERTVHFPVIGSGFMGASNTTQIKFYFKEIGDDAVKYVAVSKLPNGKVGSKVLENYYDSELDEPYALLELDSYYTQYKGDLFISLQGYQGGVQVTYDEDAELYEIEGTPTIQATGSIKFTNNYATQFVGSGEEQNITLQQLLAIISDTVLRYYVTSSNTLAEVFNEIGTKICAIDIEGNEYLCEMSGNTNIVLYDIHNQEWYAFTGANTTTIDSVLQDSNKQIIATKEDLENFGNLFTYKGDASVSEINALTDIGNGWTYNLTDSGTLTLGNLQVERGDFVAFNGSIWTKLPVLGNYYTKQQGQAFEQEVNEQISAIGNQVQQVSSGSPKGVYATLSDLETAYPTGAEGIYVVQADGHWYYWNGSAWTDGGVYQATGISENDPIIKKINDDLNYLVKDFEYTETSGYFASNGSIASAGSTTKEVYTNRFSVLPNEKVLWKVKFDPAIYNFMWVACMFYDENGAVVGSRNDLQPATQELLEVSGVITIPSNVYYVAFSYRTYGTVNALSARRLFPLEIFEQGYTSSKYFHDLLKNPRNGWIANATGVFNWSAATYTYVFKNAGITKIKCFLASDISAINAVSFYTSDDIDSSAYISSDSVAWLADKLDGAWYEITVPSTAKIIAITTRKPTATFSPQIMFLVDELLAVIDGYNFSFANEINERIDETNEEIKAKNVFALLGWQYIYHFGMDAVAYRDVPVKIPSQSVFDVRNAYYLGFKCIETNLQKTSDNKYVVTHGENGALGHDFNDLDGNDAYGVVINQKTLAELQANYRYRCESNANFRVSITTLEEFLNECKLYGLIPMCQYKDESSLEIIRNIMGENNFFMYNAPRNVYDGPILEYLSYGTKEQIIARCETVGKPYIYSMANPSSFTDEELQDIINTLHSNGYYLASAYIGSGSQYLKMGFDFIAVGSNPRPSTIINGKKLIFNNDNSVSWEDVNLEE